MKTFTLITMMLLSLSACKPTPPATQTPASPAALPPPQRIREPAVAGLFYPKDSVELSALLDKQLAEAPDHKLDGTLRAIIVPHAGYIYSGAVAAHSYRLLRGSAFTNLIILAASHYAHFPGASVADMDAYRTPLGLLPVSPRAIQLAQQQPFRPEPRVALRRPAWAEQSSKPLPALSEDTPDTWEHSGEVQVPFIQKVLPNSSIIPVVTGDVDTSEMAKVLNDFLNDQTLLVVSTDLSHYKPYDRARQLDHRCLDAICSLDTEQMPHEEACATAPIMTLLHLANVNGWKAKLLDYRNSGDTAGNKDGVVGYAAIAFCSPSRSAVLSAPGAYSSDERRVLLRLARRTVRGIVNNQLTTPPDHGTLPPRFREVKGCFVTLTKNGQLRGCIGHIQPQEALYRAVMDNAISAAMRDTRFSPVRPEELPEIEMEISVLTAPEPLVFSSPDDLLAKLQPHKDGVVLQVNGRGATYLPQVWKQMSDKVQFLNSLSAKAGCAPGAWRNPGTQVLIYHVESFKESDL